MEALATDELTMTNMEALERAICICGDGDPKLGLPELARRVGVGPMAVRQWRYRESVPPERAIDIERATEGAVTRADLRPDFFSTGQRKKVSKRSSSGGT